MPPSEVWVPPAVLPAMEESWGFLPLVLQYCRWTQQRALCWKVLCERRSNCMFFLFHFSVGLFTNLRSKTLQFWGYTSTLLVVLTINRSLGWARLESTSYYYFGAVAGISWLLMDLSKLLHLFLFFPLTNTLGPWKGKIHRTVPASFLPYLFLVCVTLGPKGRECWFHHSASSQQLLDLQSSLGIRWWVLVCLSSLSTSFP